METIAHDRGLLPPFDVMLPGFGRVEVAETRNCAGMSRAIGTVDHFGLLIWDRGAEGEPGDGRFYAFRDAEHARSFAANVVALADAMDAAG